jgi:hypothetical protein
MMQGHNLINEDDWGDADGAAQQSDRRRNQRLITILRVGKMICAKRQELCLIRNISEGGLMAHVYSPHAVGDRVAIELKTHQTVPGTIRWVNGDNVGVTFDEKVDVAEILRNQEAEDGRKPRAPRLEVHGHARLKIGPVSWHVEIRDLSQRGAKVAVSGALPTDEDAVVTIDGLRPVKAVVRWQRGGYAGLEFLPSIPLDELVHWLGLEKQPLFRESALPDVSQPAASPAST